MTQNQTLQMDTSKQKECRDLAICGTKSPRSSLHLSIGNDTMDLDCFKDLLQVVEWIEKESSENIQRVVGVSPCPVALKLENKYKSCKARIAEIEGKLEKVEEENGILREKLDGMELLAGHQQSELIRLIGELETQKWERFEAESKLKKMVDHVKEVNKAMTELITELQGEDCENGLILQINKEDDDMAEKVCERESTNRAFEQLTFYVKTRLEKCKVMQMNTRSEVGSLYQNLKKMEERLLQQKHLESIELPKVEVIPSEKVTLLHTLLSENTSEPPVIKPVPIKSILMRRSADGNFEIARNENIEQPEEHQDQQSANTRKRKSAEEHQPHTASRTENTDQSNGILPKNCEQQFPPGTDPLEPEQQSEDVAYDEKEHYETQMDRNIGDITFNCSCGKSFSHRKLLDRHLFAKGNGKIFQCSLCSQIFVFEDVLHEHMRKSHKVYNDNGSYRCRECGLEFSEHRQLRLHYKNGHHRHHK